MIFGGFIITKCPAVMPILHFQNPGYLEPGESI